MRPRGHKQVSIQLDPELHERAKVEGKRRGFKSLSAFVAHVLNTVLRGREKYEARKAGSEGEAVGRPPRES